MAGHRLHLSDDARLPVGSTCPDLARRAEARRDQVRHQRAGGRPVGVDQQAEYEHAGEDRGEQIHGVAIGVIGPQDLVEKIIGVETVDHPTDNQLVAHARRYFRAADKMLGLR